MSLRLLAVLATLSLSAAALPAAPVKAIAFGDSITFGDYDDNDIVCYDPPNGIDHCGPGYPGRLDSRLVTAGWNVDVVNEGVPGESTAGGLSRIDGVLDGQPNADFLLLMEGTNDVYKQGSKNVSAETIAFNLGQMALEAESRGLTVAVATLIPNPPWAARDPSNAETTDANDAIVSTTLDAGRRLIDVYDYFDGFINSTANYKTYYYCAPDATPTGCATEPVGHPDQRGYDKLTDPFEDEMLELLPAGASIRLPATSTAGVQADLKAFLYYPDITKLEWDFGDGGRATVTPALGSATSSVPWIFLEPGTYTVTVRWTRSGGATGTVTTTVTVAGPAPVWSTRVSLVPLALRGAGPAPDDLRFDLDLANSSGTARIVEVELLDAADPDLIPLLALAVEPPDGGWDEAAAIAALRETVPARDPAPRRWLVPTGAGLSLADLVEDGFELPATSAAARVTFYFQSGTGATSSASGELYRAASPAAGAAVAERESTSWTGDARQLTGLAPGGTVEVELAFTNVGDRDALLALTLFDAGDVDRGTIELPVVRASTVASTLAQIFPALPGLTGPFRVEIAASPVPFEAVAASVDSASGDVTEIAATP
jgi:lysophospholipase L1-like esterase/PKD repeat protein